MKLRRIRVENVRSFLDPAELVVDGDISILIGPNGGGKTNLLDTITIVLRSLFIKPWRWRYEENPRRRIFEIATNINMRQLSKHAAGKGKDQRIEIELELTGRDLENMRKIKESSQQMLAYSEDHSYINVAFGTAKDWKLDLLSEGLRLKYEVVNGAVPQVTPEAQIFLEYLSFVDLDAVIRSEAQGAPLSMPFIYMPVARSAAGFTSMVSLSQADDSALKQSVEQTTSRAAGSITQLAIARIAEKYVDLIHDDNVAAKDAFQREPAIKSITEVLEELGYAWKLEVVSKRSNQYNIRLTKDGSDFLVDDASSGERELLTYVFGIYALNVRDALIVIDEPELHLHPKWQRILLNVFEKLSKDTGNQFLMATHSPVFVAPSSIEYISRVYAQEQRSKIVRLNNKGLPDVRHLFSIVNSQNNEKIFFADHVVLVEGISDRLFFEKMIAARRPADVGSRLYEVVDVGGKTMFAQYKRLLGTVGVPSSIVADRDYAADIGPEEVKKVFHFKPAGMSKKVIKDPSSRDGAALVHYLDAAITGGDLTQLRELWNYIKSRHSKFGHALTHDQKTLFSRFLEEQRKLQVFILAEGSLEAYLPIGFRSKDLNLLIPFLDTPKFWAQVGPDKESELNAILDGIYGHAKS